MTDQDRLRQAIINLELEIRSSELIIKNLERDIERVDLRERIRLQTMKEREEQTLARFRNALDIATKGVRSYA
jgi:hypothetical protein